MKLNFTHMLPFLSDDEIHEIVLKMISSSDGTFEGITPQMIAPFAEDEDVDALLDGLLAKGLKPYVLYPFASDEGVKKAMDACLKTKNLEGFYKGLPFVDDDDLDELVKKSLKEGPSSPLLQAGVSLKSLYPFLDDEVLSEIFFALVDSQPLEAKSLYPFLEDEDWERLINECKKGQHPDFNWDEAYPFVDEDDLQDLFEAAIKNHQ